MEKVVLNEREKQLYELAINPSMLAAFGDVYRVMELYLMLSGMSREASDCYTNVMIKLYQDGVIK